MDIASNIKSARKLVSVIGGRLIGTDPFDRRSWSGISYYLHKELESQGQLDRAFGVDLGRGESRKLMIRNFYPNRNIWRQRYYFDIENRNRLTKRVEEQLREDDFQSDFLQIGAVFDLPSLVNNRSRCYSYHDGNLAMRLNNPYTDLHLSVRRIEAALEYEKSLYHRLDQIFTMSEYLRRSFIDDFGVPSDKVVCIGAGVNLDEIPEDDPDKDYDSKEILFIGIDFVRKGGEVLLDTFKALREKHLNAVLHIVGPENLNMPSELTDGVCYHGFLRKEVPSEVNKLKELFRRSSLFVLPSLYEPFGIAPAEAMLYGIPAIVSGDWALAETVINGESGWHVEPGSVDSLYAALDEGLSDAGERQRRGRIAALRSRESFLWNQVVGRLAVAID